MPSPVIDSVMFLEAERTSSCSGFGDQDQIRSKSTIARSYGLIPEWYLVHVHQTVIREVDAGSLAGDSMAEVHVV